MRVSRNTSHRVGHRADPRADPNLRRATAERIRRSGSGAHVARRRDDGLQDSSIRRELAVFSAAIHHYNRIHEADLRNPSGAAFAGLAPHPQGRARWLTREQAAALLAEAGRSKALHLVDFITLALQTGMRRGDLLGMEWTRVDLH